MPFRFLSIYKEIRYQCFACFQTYGADVFRNLIIFAAAVAAFNFTALCFAGNFPGFPGNKEGAGRTRMKTIQFEDLQLSVTEKPQNEGYTLQFLRDGNPIYTGECAFRVHDPKIVTGIPLPNCRSVLAYCFSGGAHCCMTLLTATNCSQEKTLTAVDLAHSDGEVQFVSADGKAAREMKVMDWQLAYYGPENSDLQLSFADSPGMDRLLVFDNGKWRVDRAGEFKRYYETRLEKSRTAALAAAGKRNGVDRAAASAIQAAYYSLMSGKSADDSREMLNLLLPASWKPESAGIIEDIRRAVTEYNPVEELH